MRTLGRKYYEILGRLDARGVLPDDRERYQEYVLKFIELQRLAKKHHKLAEMDCNGEGRIKGVHYYNGVIDDYAKRTYGFGVRSAFVADDETVFDVESSKIEEKIKRITLELKLDVEFQGDPRGATVRIKIRNTHIDLSDILWT